MHAFWCYQCDLGHGWMIYRLADAAEAPGDTVCPHGHAAVTRKILTHSDRTRIALLPAALVVDDDTGQIGDEDRCFVLIARVDGAEERMSQRHYGWSEALRVAERFRNREFARSLRLWEQTSP